MHNLIKKLFKIPRSITGNGVRATLAHLQKICPLMTIHEVPTGTQVFDWLVPKEWNIRDAWIKDPSGKKIIDFKKNNLHIMGYSTPVHKKCSLDELLQCVYTLPEQPDYIPYITSYYQERYGFCMTESMKNSLAKGEYEIYIDSDLKDGALTYGEIIIPSSLAHKNEKEIFLSTYVCHPQMANNELSGPVVAIHLAKWLMSRKNRYTYRFFFGPETIGSIVYLSRNIEILKKNVVAGFVLSCVGDERAYSYIESPYADTLADKVAKNVLHFHAPEYKTYSFLTRGSDERQYCSCNVHLPMCSVLRSKYGEYPEYHTSADDLALVTEKGLQGSLSVYKKMITALEHNNYYTMNCCGEPQLGKRGLYPTLSTKKSGNIVRDMMNLIAYADGTNDLLDISNKINVDVDSLIQIIEKLVKANLIKETS